MESSEIGPYCQAFYQQTVVAVPAAAQQWKVVPSQRNEAWSQEQYDYRRHPRERVPPQRHHSDGYCNVFNVPKRPPLLGKMPPLLNKRPPLLVRHDEGGYSKYYSHVDCRVRDAIHSFSRNQRRGPSHIYHHESGYRWARDDHPTSQQPDCKGMKNSFRRKKFYYSHYSRKRFPPKRDVSVFKESPAGWKNYPLNRSSSRINSRRYSQEQSRAPSFHHSQNRLKERSIQALKSSRHKLPSCSAVSSKVLEKASRVTEKELDEPETKCVNKIQENSEKNNLAEISKFKAQSKALLFIEQTEEPKSNTTEEPKSNTTEEPKSNRTGGTEMYENNQLSSRSEAIIMKSKEIEKLYQQDCETFTMVVKMLIEKDPSLEKPILFSLKQCLHEIGELCVDELKHFITEFDNSTQEFGRPF